MLKLNNGELKEKLIDILLGSYEGWIKSLHDCVDNGMTYLDALLASETGNLCDTVLRGGKCPASLYKNYAITISCEESCITLHLFSQVEEDNHKFYTAIKYVTEPKPDVSNFVHTLEDENDQILFGNNIYCQINGGYCTIDLDDVRVHKAIKTCIKVYKEELSELLIKHLD